MHHEKQLQDCIKVCWDCRNKCQKTFFNYCLQMGGDHLKEAHVKLMTDCIQICQITADFMTRLSSFDKAICEVCAMICEACAKSCDDLKTEEMQSCAYVCRRCAESCQAMAKM